MMKNYISCQFFFTLFIIIFIFSYTHAKVNLGISSGINVSTLISKPQGLLTISNRKYFGVGSTGEYNLNKGLSLNFGVFYLPKGTKFKIEGQGDINAKFDLEYINFPLVLSYSFKIPFFKLYIHSGFFMEHNLSAKLRYEGTDFTSNQNIKNEIKNNNHGFLIGGGLKTMREKNILFAEIYYSKGLINLYDNKNYSDYSLYTEGIQIFLGYKFKIY